MRTIIVSPQLPDLSSKSVRENGPAPTVRARRMVETVRGERSASTEDARWLAREALWRLGGVGSLPQRPRPRGGRLYRQQGRAEIAQPGEQPEQLRLVDDPTSQRGRRVRFLDNVKSAEPRRPGWIKVAKDADAVTRGRAIGGHHAAPTV